MKLKHEEVNSPSPEAQNPPYRAIPVSPRPWWQAEVLQLKRSPRSLKAEHASPVTEDAQLPRAHAPLTPLPVSPPPWRLVQEGWLSFPTRSASLLRRPRGQECPGTHSRAGQAGWARPRGPEAQASSTGPLEVPHPLERTSLRGDCKPLSGSEVYLSKSCARRLGIRPGPSQVLAPAGREEVAAAAAQTPLCSSQWAQMHGAPPACGT